MLNFAIASHASHFWWNCRFAFIVISEIFYQHPRQIFTITVMFHIESKCDKISYRAVNVWQIEPRRMVA